ncbi:MAG: hypothetical protein JOZ57_00110, partial [Abitibacteriaceae bacterium]|nr:hypothetical protein [Abditibacteriaceae bacterium]
MKIPMIHALVMNFALLVAVSSVVAEAQSANSPRELFVAAGEIRVDGKIRSVDLTQKQLVLDVSSFSLPDGKTSELAVPKSKIIVLNEDTLLHVRGAVTHKVAMADVKAGTSAIVIGQDAGSGQPLPAREVALWDKAETGVFGLSTQNADSIVATKPNNQVGQKADDNQAVEANDGPDEIAQNKASNVFAQGDFELANEQAKPQGWSYAATQNIQWLTENGNHYMHISRDNPHEGHIIGNKLILDPSWKKLKILARMRVQNLKVGTEEWQNARLSLRYEDATGKTVDYAPPLEFKTDSAWVTRKLITAIPNGTHHLVIEPGVYGPAGELDIDDIVIVPNPPLDALPIEDGFPAGKFEKIGSNGDPVGWDLNDRKRIQWLEEDGNHFVRVTSEVAHNYVMASGLFKL